MMSSRFSGGSRVPGLFVSGLVAGALGMALSAGSGSASSSSGSHTADSTWGPYGKPHHDSGMSSSGTGPSGSSGVGGAVSSGSYGTGASSTDAMSTGTSSNSGATGVGGTGSADLSGSSATGMTGSPLPPNVSPGWKIRVCSEKTKADMLTFKFSQGDKSKTGMKGTAGAEGTGMGGASSTTGDAATTDQTTTWTRGESSEIMLPATLRDADKIRVETTGEKDKRSSVCVIYDDHVAKQLSFKNNDVSTVKRDASGTCGC